VPLNDEIITNDDDDDDSVSPNVHPRAVKTDDKKSDSKDEEEAEADTIRYQLRSGKELRLQNGDDFPRSRSGQRNIPPDQFGANVSYQKIGFPGKNMSAYQCR
jgi:hypothetical protein